MKKKNRINKEKLVIIKIRDSFNEFVKEMANYRNLFPADYIELLCDGTYNLVTEKELLNRINTIGLEHLKNKFIEKNLESYEFICKYNKLELDKKESDDYFIKQKRFQFNKFIIEVVTNEDF